jgi:hypothetical protein
LAAGRVCGKGLLVERDIEEFAIAGYLVEIDGLEVLEAHGPVGKLACLDGAFDERVDVAMAAVGGDGFEEGADDTLLALKELHEVAILVKEHAGDLHPGIFLAALLEKEEEFFVGKASFLAAGV